MDVAILTVSDRVSRGEAEDRSGPALAALVLSAGWRVADTRVVADDAAAIAAAVAQWTDAAGGAAPGLVVTTGGTGFGARDVTPEAVAPLLERAAPGLVAAMLAAGLAATPLAALARPVAGVRRRSLVLTLPGSPKGATENLAALLSVLPHAVELVRGGPTAGDATHAKMIKDAAHSHSHSHSHSHHKSHVHVCHHTSDRVDVSEKVEAFGLSSDLDATVANRVRKSAYPLIPFDQALKTVMEHATVLSPRVMKVSDSLAGHILAQDVKAVDPVPGYRASVVDGYAVISSDGPGVYPVSQVQHAGAPDQASDGHILKSGTIARVTTGAMVPEGADAVVMVEDTELVDSSASGEEVNIRILKSAVQKNENIRAIGSDAAVGELILENGSLVSAAGGEVGLLASVGVTDVLAHPHPTISILSTGNELVHYSTPSPLPAPYVRDTNFPSLATAIQAAMPHCTILTSPLVAQDTQDSLYNLLHNAIESQSNVIITTGGVSMGEADMMKSVLERRLGAKIWFGRVLMKPGKPTTFATVEKNGVEKLIFALPGNPVSALVGFYLFVLPALRKMAGYPSPNLQSVLAKVAHSIQLDARPEFYRVHLSLELDSVNGVTRFIAHGTGSQMSSRMLSMRGANALLKLPPATSEKQSLAEGDVVEAFLI
ncbi:hypothetical protein BDR26DRAFT_1010595 [Obelidium mucronatum]|nr:hypothetical protein BDR26DRAFT_1010595 [Obelidium mucronatum]